MSLVRWPLWWWCWRTTLITRGALLLARKQYKAAELLCRKGVRLSPSDPVCHAWLAQAVWKQGRLEEALQEYRVAIGLRRGALSADRIDVIQILLEGKKYEEAITESQKLLDPNFHRISPFFRSVHELTAYRSLYEAYFALGDYAQAKEALVRLLPYYKKQKSREGILQRLRLCEDYLRRASDEPS